MRFSAVISAPAQRAENLSNDHWATIVKMGAQLIGKEHPQRG
jgi:hypothetical protein